MPKIKLEIKNFLYILIGLVIIILLITVYLYGGRERPPRPVTLEFWSIFDDSDVYQDLIYEFNKKYPYIEIKYYKKSFDNYENELINALAVNRGPDIFSIHNTWLAKHKDKLSVLPQRLMTLKDYQSTFVDVAFEDFVSEDNQIYALPFYVDTLALYYNKDYFNAAGIAQPPKTWEEFMEDVEKLTVRDEAGNIIRAGAAIGTAKNINRSTDILGLLMLQNGTKMVNEEKTRAEFDQQVYLDNKSYKSGEDALRFYTDFANPRKRVYTWNRQMDYSIDAFYEGKVAMMFNYAYHFPTIRTKSPYLNFAVAPVPQIKGAAKKINYANYWAQAVSAKSKNSQYAWQFLIWMTEKENLQKYAQKTKRPVSRRDLISWQRNDLEIGVFAEQALTAQSWYQVDNSAIEKIFADMIESVVLGQADLGEAISKAAQQVTVLMWK